MLIGLSEIWKNEQWVGTDHSLSFDDAKGNHYVFNGYKIEITWEKITSVESKLIENLSINTFPNPFTNSTTIKYTTDFPTQVRINIYNAIGNKITKLKDEFQSAGEHQAIFIGDNLSTGIYYYTIQIGERIESGKLLLIR